jgi:hypothetical protein
LSQFGGSAWQWDSVTGQYYYHAFLPAQPDLNWRNPEVRAAMHEVLRFWLRRGVDGFRVDVLWHLIKDDQWRNNPPNPGYRAGQEPPHRSQIPLYTADRPEVQPVVTEMRRVVDEFDDRVLIGEIYLPIERWDAARWSSPALQLSVAAEPLECALDRSPDRSIRAHIAAGRLAQLGAGQSRYCENRFPHRHSASARRRDAPLDAARHADDVLRGRARHDEYRHPS